MSSLNLFTDVVYNYSAWLFHQWTISVCLYLLAVGDSTREQNVGCTKCPAQNLPTYTDLPQASRLVTYGLYQACRLVTWVAYRLVTWLVCRLVTWLAGW